MGVGAEVAEEGNVWGKNYIHLHVYRILQLVYDGYFVAHWFSSGGY